MAFKLTKDERAQREELTERLTISMQELDEALTKFNDRLEELRDEMIIAEQEYNGVLSDVREFAQGVHDRIESEFEEKSEKWQEGDKAQSVTEWKDAWYELASLSDVEIEYPQDIDPLSLEDVDKFNEVSSESE